MTWPIGIRAIKSRNDKKSFSLFELLVVVVIIGLLLSISLPRFKGTFSNLKFENFCQNLFSRIIYLQERATFEQVTYRIHFQLNNGLIKIQVANDATEEFVQLGGLLGKDIVIPDNIGIDIESPYLLFYPDGGLEGGDIVVSSSQSEAIIYIKESTGQARLEIGNE